MATLVLKFKWRPYCANGARLLWLQQNACYSRMSVCDFQLKHSFWEKSSPRRLTCTIPAASGLFSFIVTQNETEQEVIAGNESPTAPLNLFYLDKMVVLVFCCTLSTTCFCRVGDNSERVVETRKRPNEEIYSCFDTKEQQSPQCFFKNELNLCL